MLGIVFEVVGWFGALTLFTVYLLFSLNRIANGYLFQAANLIGATAMVINGAYHASWPSAIANVAWGSIAGFALIQLKRRDTNSQIPPQPEDVQHYRPPLPGPDIIFDAALHPCAPTGHAYSDPESFIRE